MNATAKMASHSHNADPSTATASSAASLVLPSFTQSRTYTYESEDANSRCSDAYTNNTNNYEDDNTSMASESMASASTANTANMSSPGGQQQYSSKSARYKSAMTSRARQRRMRRMRERNGNGNGSNSAVDTSGDSVSVNTPNNGGGLLAPISPGTPNTPTGSTTTPISTNNTPTNNNSPARVQQAKEHVEQMKLYQEQMRQYRSSSSSPNNQQQQQQQQSGAPGTPTVLQPTRLLEKSRNRSFGSRGGGSRDPSPTPSPSPYSPGEVVVSNNTAGPHHSASASAASGARVVVSSVSNTPQRSNSTNSNRASAPASASPSTRSSGNDLISSYTKSATSKKKKEQKSSSSYRPNTTDFIPNWSIESPGDNGMLNPEEVQNAANYTSIKFQYSTMSGATAGEGGSPGTEEGLEVFSDDGTHQYDDDRTADTGSVLSGSVFSGHYGNTTNGRNTPLGMVGNLQNATHPAQQHQAQQAAESTTTTNNNKQTWQNDVWSEATTPTILQGNEIFHQKAAASIVSLLSPNRMLGAGLMAPTISDPNYQDESSKDVDADSPTGIVPSAGNKEAMRGMFTFDSDGDPSSSRGGEWRGMTQVNRTLFRREDLDEDVKQSMIFQAFRQNMMQPSVQLSELLTQIHRRGGVSIDRAFATRRKNACGALKILSAKEENRMKICWTLGVLPAIASVLSDVSEGISDDISLAANTEARNRIVSTLLNLSVSKKNRMLIVNTPGVLESMVQTIQYDTGESRQGCCTVLLYLAKTAECRSMLVKSAGMMEALSKVIEVPKEEVVNNKKKSTRKNSIKSRLLASVPVSPLGPGSPGESTLDDTINTGRSSYRSEMSEDDDDSHSSHSGSHSSHSGSGSHSGASGDDEDGNDESVASNVPIEEVDQMEISFQTAETTLVQNTTLDTTKKFAEGEDDEEVKDDFYDADPNRFLHGARLSIFACLLCCVKSKENAFTLAREQIIVEALIGVCRRHASPSHSRAIAILAHLTRHPKNSHLLVYKYTSLLPMLQAATGSPDKEARRYAFCALQNLSMDKSCRAPIAHSPKIIWSLTQRCKDKSAIDEDEARMAAVATLQNLSDEPANLIQFTIVKDCIGTIISIAREDVTQNERTDLASFMAKNTLVTLSHWFRKIATSGSERMVGLEVIGQPKRMAGFPPGGGLSPGGSSPGGSKSQSRLYSAVLEPTNYSQWS